MSYKLYTDKHEIFECKIHLEGASLKNANARMIVKTKDLSLMYEGVIDIEGNCQIPIKKLGGLLNENEKGDMKLEIIAEDVYFEPWQSDFEVDTAKKVTVEVSSQQGRKKVKPWYLVENKKPKATVTKVKNNNVMKNPVADIVTVLNENGITLKTIVKNKNKVAPILDNYSSKVNYKGGTKKFIREVIQKLSKK